MKTINFKDKIEIPSEVQFELVGRRVTIKGPVGEVSKVFKMPMLKFSKEGNLLSIECKKYGKYEKEKLYTVRAHIKNMIQGSKENYLYKLKICSSHFPMNVAVNGNKFVVKNILGEKVPRELVLKQGSKVDIKGDIIEVSGSDKELVSQTAADIEQLTKIKHKDRRIFQDGIYITHKAGKGV